MWFEIEPDSSLIAGLYHKFKEINFSWSTKLKVVVKKLKHMKEITKTYIAKGAWHAHLEHILLALLSSSSKDNRRFALLTRLDKRLPKSRVGGQGQ